MEKSKTAVSSRGILLTDSFQINKNFEIHRRNFRAIQNRKPVVDQAHLRPKRQTSQPSMQRYKPFLNFSSKMVELKYFYNPNHPISSLRIFNENRDIAGRLERIHLKRGRADDQRHMPLKSNFHQTVRDRQLQYENMSIAKRILEMKSSGIKSESVDRDFENYKLYKKLRSCPSSMAKFRALTSGGKERLYRAGRGNVRVIIKLKSLNFRGYIPQFDDSFIAVLRGRDRKTETPIVTLPELLDSTFQVRLRDRDLTSKPLPIRMQIIQCKATETIGQGWFGIPAEDLELGGDGKTLSLDIVKKSGWDNGTATVEVSSWRRPKRVRRKNQSMQEKDEEYIDSSEDGE